MSAVATTALFSTELFRFSVTMITHKPLHLAR